MNDLKVKTVTITLTQSCNLSCSYCYEHYKSPKRMDFETAKKIIDSELSDISDLDVIEFDLFGGEPFLEFELVKSITKYISKRGCPIPFTIFATTNGTLVHGEIQEWLRDHANCVVCGLSLDGTREMHNTNRSCSYDDIDIDFFRTQYPNQDVKMTISHETLPFLAAGVIDMHKKGFLVACNLAFDIDWSASENVDILNRELNKLIEFYLKNPDIEPCSMLGMGIDTVGVQTDYAVRYCGAGKHMRSYDVDGRMYPCQFFMPLSLGEEQSEKAKAIQFPDDQFPKALLDTKCQTCIIQPVCPNCFGANYASTRNIYRRDDNLCRLTKIIMKARSYFRAKQWEHGQLDLSAEDMQALMYAIIKIQEELELE